MAQTTTFGAERRERAGKGAARATRRAGRIPAVIYGNKQDPVLISLEPIELLHRLREHGFFSRVFEIRFDGTSERALARDVQFHPVTDRPLHVDFMRFSADTKVTVEVEVVFENDTASPGLKKGGVLNIVAHGIELICSPESIPQFITVDLTGKEIGDSVHLSDLDLPGDVKPVTDDDITVCTIAAPTKAAEEAGAEAAEGEEEAVEAEAAEGGDE